MDNTGQQIGPLKKVSLNITAGGQPQSTDIIDAPESMQFIFAAGVDGLTEFEYLIAGKRTGDKIDLKVEKNRLHEMFEHLVRYLPCFPDTIDILYLKLTVVDISDAAQREVVTALADAAACGSDCDCGCSGH